MTIFEVITHPSTMRYVELLVKSDTANVVHIDLDCSYTSQLYKNKKGITFEILLQDSRLGPYFQPIACYDYYKRCFILKEFIEHYIDNQPIGLNLTWFSNSHIVDMAFMDKALIGAFSVPVISSILEHRKDMKLKNLEFEFEIWDADDGDFNIYLDDNYTLPFDQASQIIGSVNVYTEVYAPTKILDGDSIRLQEWGMFSILKTTT